MNTTLEIAQAAARLIADEGLSWGAAKQRALRDLGLSPRTPLPPHEAVEDALREHLSLFQAETQPAELRALRELALRWMDRLSDFDPVVVGAVWRGTANRWSDVHLHLFSDDPKAPEMALLNAGLHPEPGERVRDSRGREAQTLAIWLPPPQGLSQPVALHLTVLDSIDRRGALLPDARGAPLRGDTRALRRLLDASICD